MTKTLNVNLCVEEAQQMLVEHFAQDSYFQRVEVKINVPPIPALHGENARVNKIALIKFMREACQDALNGKMELHTNDNGTRYPGLATAKLYVEKYFNIQ